VTIDLFTASLMTAVVCNVAGACFIIETLLRRDEGVGRTWSLAFLCGMATTVAYMMWASGTGGYLAVAIGNGLFVSTAGCLWLGSRRFNQRGLTAPGVVVVTVGLVVVGAAVVEGPDGGDWAGWVPMGFALIAFGALAAVETVRPPMGRIRTSWALAVVFAIEVVFYAARVGVFIVAGPESDAFRTYFSTNVTSVLTVCLTIVAVVVTSVLRASRSDLRTYSWMTQSGVSSDGILTAPTFVRALQDVTERSSWRQELVGVISVRIEDLPQIATAFGTEAADEVETAWRQGVRRYAAPSAFVGQEDRAELLVAVVPGTAADARRQASVIYNGLFETLGAVTGAVIPVVGVGVALTETVGYDPDRLVRHARDAAHRAAVNPDSSVVFGGTPGIVRPRQD
jgi:hypothetical protein